MPVSMNSDGMSTVNGGPPLRPVILSVSLVTKNVFGPALPGAIVHPWRRADFFTHTSCVGEGRMLARPPEGHQPPIGSNGG